MRFALIISDIVFQLSERFSGSCCSPNVLEGGVGFGSIKIQLLDDLHFFDQVEQVNSRSWLSHLIFIDLILSSSLYRI